jgi:hypothetical protein
MRTVVTAAAIFANGTYFVDTPRMLVSSIVIEIIVIDQILDHFLHHPAH